MITGEAARTVEDGQPAVGVFVHAHLGLDVVVAVAVGRDLQAQAPVGDAVVAADDAVFLKAKDIAEIASDVGNEGAAHLGRGHPEGGVVGRQEDLA